MDLLAHISAPTWYKNDQKYRSQARNFIAFNTGKRMRLSGYHMDSGDDRLGSSAGSSQGLDVRDFAYIDDTQLAISAFESQIITSSLQYPSGTSDLADNGTQGRTRRRPCAVPISSERSQALRVAPQTGAGSVRSSEASTQRVDHANSPHTDFSLALPRQEDAERYGCDAMSSAGLQQGHIQHNVQDRIDPRRPHVIAGDESSSWSDNALPMELPSTYSISDETSKGSNHGQSHSCELPRTPIQYRNGISRPLRTDLTTIASESARSPAPRAITCPDGVVRRAPSKLPSPPIHPTGIGTADSPTGDENIAVDTPSRVLKVSDLAEPPHPAGMVSSTPKPSSAGLDSTSKVTVKASKLSALPSIILPPPPEVSIKSGPESFITPNLRKLKEDHKLADRYRPQYTARDLEHQERGYWMFSPTRPHWDIQLEQDFWDFMARLVESGNIGSGVWCARLPVTNNCSSPRGSEQLCEIRVFCWGEIVEHVYLLIYVASRNKVKKSNPVWCDASGKVVIRVRRDDIEIETIVASTGPQ